MPEDASMDELDKMATARWSIEQCFQECKGYLGMTHYEIRSYRAWHRHMLFVMIAHLFVTVLRQFLKKIRGGHDSDGFIYHRFTDPHSYKAGDCLENHPLSLAS
jgi:SRSO17 transposase